MEENVTKILNSKWKLQRLLKFSWQEPEKKNENKYNTGGWVKELGEKRKRKKLIAFWEKAC